jgi:hypothetical protein
MRLLPSRALGVVATLAVTALVAACSEAHFFGQSPRISGSPLQPTRHRDDPDLPAGGDSGDPGTPDTGNDDGKRPGQTPTDEPVQTDDQVRCLGKQSVLQGAQQDEAWHAQADLEACLRGDAPLLVVVLVDQSGTMGRHRASGGSLDAGLDPWTGGGCRRLDGVRDVTKHLAAATDDGARVSIEVVPFAGRVLETRVLGPTSLAAVESKLTPDLLCSYVVGDAALGFHPGNPGGLDGDRLGTQPVSSGADLNAAVRYANRAAAAADVDRALIYVLGSESLAIQTVGP